MTQRLVTFAFLVLLALHAASGRPARAEAMPTAMQNLNHLQAMNAAIQNLWIGAIQQMTEQLSAEMMEQAVIVGTFIDASYQMETQRVLQDRDTQTMKAYTPSTQMCIIGTNTRSLAMAEQKSKANAAVLNNAMLGRSLLTHDELGGQGPADDVRSRLRQYSQIYCNPADNDRTLGFLCQNEPPRARQNRDINYTDLVDGPMTMDVDLTDTAMTSDEEDVFALSHNLYSNTVLPYMPQDLLLEGYVNHLGPAAWVYQQMRSLQAVRAVAQNSFAHLIGMKARSNATQVFPFMSEIMKELGVPEADITQFLGANPSYFAQMDVLTKRIYMAPDFFVNLFTQPANVERLGATLQAVGLMSDRDRFEAALRREMLISMIVEMKLRAVERDEDDSFLGDAPNLYVP